MLLQLQLSQFALVDELTLDFDKGLNVVSGETGAGKSLLFSALQLLMGGRADADWVRTGAEKADLTATLDVTNKPEVLSWLVAQDLLDIDLKSAGAADCECMIRRVIRKDGKSRAYINGVACPANQLKQLSGILFEYHGQHQYTSLLNSDTQLAWFDRLTGAAIYLPDLSKAYKNWRKLTSKLEETHRSIREASQRKNFLEYQLEEMEQVSADLEILEALELKQKNFHLAEEQLNIAHQVLSLLSGSNELNCTQCMTQAMQCLTAGSRDIAVKKDVYLDRRLGGTQEMLHIAEIHLQEAVKELEGYVQDTHLDPEEAVNIENRLSAVYRLARKHQVSPGELLALEADFRLELEKTEHLDETLFALELDVKEAYNQYAQLAEQVSKVRRAGQPEFERMVTLGLQGLGLEKVRFVASLLDRDAATMNSSLGSEPNKGFEKGKESLTFLFSPNAGHAMKPLQKIASGGELSRISLVLQTCVYQMQQTKKAKPTSKQKQTSSSDAPVFIFDEVDVGVSGAVAERIGDMLKALGQVTQVFCITHSPQVAAKGDTHWKANKLESKEGVVVSRWAVLNQGARVQELARMLGGLKITKQTCSHAQELLTSAHPSTQQKIQNSKVSARVA